MTTTIALAGKGGVGKTTTAAMIIKYLVSSQPGAILAIDADPSSNLNMVLGLDLDWTVGEIRENLLDIHAVKALFSPSTGIFDTHQYMQALEHICLENENLNCVAAQLRVFIIISFVRC